MSGRWFLVTIELIVLSGLILVTRCANYQDVFLSGKSTFSTPTVMRG